MSWKIKASRARTLTFRLTLWYAVLFGLSALAGFGFVYASLTASLRERTDEHLRSTAREFEPVDVRARLDTLRDEFRREVISHGVTNVFLQLLTSDGRVVLESDMGAWGGVRALRRPEDVLGDAVERVYTVALPGRPHRVRVIVRKTRDGHVIRAGTTLREDELLMARYREVFGAVLAVMLACGGVAGWLMARRAMSGVRRVTEAASRIGKEGLDRRVPVLSEGREIEELARAFNEMLGRIEALVGELKEVSDNVAHDLRSPITRIRVMAETALAGAQDIEAWRETAGSIIEESDRLVEIINTMLEIAQAEAGVAELFTEPVDLKGVVRDATDLFLPVVEDKEIRLEADLSSEPVNVLADRAKIQRVVANLLDNAVKFTPQGGRVRVSVRGNGSRALVEVSDTGIGIERNDLPRIFDRFYRAEKSRSAPGNGLGLSLALAFVRAHGGEITVSSAPGQGSVFTVFLPLSHPSP